MKRFFIYVLLNLTIVIYAQEGVPLEPLINTDPAISSNIEVLLYEIDLENIKIPISLKYNTSGIKADEIPSVTGVSWKLNDIGKVTRKINHMPDEKTSTGWFFSNDNTPYSHIGRNPAGGHEAFAEVDSSPDFFSVSIATGINATFIYKKNFNGDALQAPKSLFIDRNQHLKLTTDVNKFHWGVTNYSDVIFSIDDENGIKYSFIGGPNKFDETEFGYQVGYQYKDFYVNKIESTHNTDIITIKYLENLKNRNRNTVNGEYGNYNDNEYATIYELYHYIVSDATLEIDEIVTPREKLKFTYSVVPVGNQQEYSFQYVKQLNEIEVFNLEDEFVTGFKFFYSNFNDGRFILSSIRKWNKTKTDLELIKKFTYNEASPETVTSTNVDMFGYSRPTGNGPYAFPFVNTLCATGLPLPPVNPSANRLPDLQTIVSAGMLTKVTNNFGGVTEYEYQLNADQNYYGGGVVISKIIEHFSDNKVKTTTFTYENLRGMVLPINDYSLYFKISYLPFFGTMGASTHPYSLLDTDPLDYTGGFEYYANQNSGSYFEKVTTRINYDKAEDGITDINLVTVNEYIPNYEGIVRRAMLKKQRVFKEIGANSPETNVSIKEIENIYDLLSLDNVAAVDAKHYFTRTLCDTGGGVGMYIFTRRPVYLVNQPLVETKETEYIYGIIPSTIETKKKFIYISNGPYDNYFFDKLRPSEIITYKNDTPVSKKKFSYEFQFYDWGLSNLIEFNSQERTLLREESLWLYNLDEYWILKEAEFYKYFDDGKLQEYSKVYRNHLDDGIFNNGFYEEREYNPHVNGFLSNVIPKDIIRLNYDTSGKISSVIDYKTGQLTAFSRNNGKDSYSINTILKGNRNALGTYSFYRSSFENEGNYNIESSIAYTGSKVYSSSTLNLGYYQPNYVVSFWYYKDGKWQFSSYTHNGGTLTINRPSGSLYIDEVWVRPPNTKITGYTLQPLIGKTSVIDDNGLVLKTIFDEFGRAVKQADQDNNLLHKRKYNLIQDAQ
ncbi:hypothetical protein KJK34_07255 [Flavobacterium sp. D11R37]|uniref:hypothetical protein n=1 Tax=Flavobacterium coralii TaxID=2838017 RepID=UPI001CA73105|nr:hypothetical protein [Flavobacterium coralii]MBY8962547.1 hypothetical protein [Flavobacterium coralii]